MNKPLKILLVSSGLFSLAGGLFGPLYAVFVEEIGGGLLMAGSSYSAFAIASGVLLFVLSRWEDHTDHPGKFMITGYALNSIAYLGYFFVENPFQLIIAQVVLGLGQAVSTPAFDGLYSRYMDEGEYVYEWGVWESMNMILIGLAAILGGWFASEFGFRALFLVMFGLSFAGMIVSSGILYYKDEN